MAQIAVDPEELRLRAAALRQLSLSVHATSVHMAVPDCGDVLATEAVGALLRCVGDALPAVAVELTTVSTIVARGATAYDRTEAAVARE